MDEAKEVLHKLAKYELDMARTLSVREVKDFLAQFEDPTPGATLAELGRVDSGVRSQPETAFSTRADEVKVSMRFLFVSLLDCAGEVDCIQGSLRSKRWTRYWESLACFFNTGFVAGVAWYGSYGAVSLAYAILSVGLYVLLSVQFNPHERTQAIVVEAGLSCAVWALLLVELVHLCQHPASS